MTSLKIWRSFQVSGLKPNIPVNELLSTFDSFGRLSHLEIMQDGLVHIGYYNNRDAENAFGILHNSLVLGNLVELKWIDDDVRDPIRTFIISNLSKDISDEGLQALFVPFGDLLCCVIDRDDQGNSLGTGQVHYKECKVENVLYNLNNVDVNNIQLHVEFLKSPIQELYCFKTGPKGDTMGYSHLFVNNINKNVSEYQIHCEFKAFGNLKYIQIEFREEQQCAYIYYDNAKAVVNAVNSMAKRMEIPDTSNVCVVNDFAEPSHFSQIATLPIVASGEHTPVSDMSWKLTWQVFITPSFDPTTRWNVYQISFQ